VVLVAWAMKTSAGASSQRTHVSVGFGMFAGQISGVKESRQP
jgi:hypothetical protein